MKEQKVLEFYVLCNKLKNVIRTGWIEWNVKRERIESIAEHVYGVQMLALAMYSEYKEDYKPIYNEYTYNFCYIKYSKVIGFIIYTSLYENVEIVDLFVSEKYRNKRIGSMLLNEVLRRNKKKNISLEVNVNNENAIKLYKNNKFEIASIRKGYYNGIDGYLMVKK